MKGLQKCVLCLRWTYTFFSKLVSFTYFLCCNTFFNLYQSPIIITYTYLHIYTHPNTAVCPYMCIVVLPTLGQRGNPTTNGKQTNKNRKQKCLAYFFPFLPLSTGNRRAGPPGWLAGEAGGGFPASLFCQRSLPVIIFSSRFQAYQCLRK